MSGVLYPPHLTKETMRILNAGRLDDRRPSAPHFMSVLSRRGASFQKSTKKREKTKRAWKRGGKNAQNAPFSPLQTQHAAHTRHGALGEGVSLHRSFFLTLTSMYNTANSLEFRSSAPPSSNSPTHGSWQVASWYSTLHSANSCSSRALTLPL